MPHRDPLLAAQARCAQLRQRVGEREEGEPTSLGAALAEEERLLRVLEALDGADAAIEPDTGSFFAVARPIGEEGNNEQPHAVRKETRLRVAAALLALCAAAMAPILALWHELPRRPAAAAPARVDSYFVTEVVSRTGAINARVGDRCKVELHIGGREDCRMNVVCPGVERRFSSPSCSLPADGVRVEAHWPGVDFDSEVLSFSDMDEEGRDRGRAIARIAAWR